MRLVTYDFECFKHDWLVVFKDKESGIYTIIHNNPLQFQQCIDDDTIYVGFNNKHYDYFISKAVYAMFTPEQVHEVNDWIIAEQKQGWDYPGLKDVRFYMNQCDMMDDMTKGLSLKAIEGHLGINIKESDVPFDIDRPLNKAELEETIEYCKHDVDSTEMILDLRKDYLINKVHIGRLADTADARALSMTNAKLTAVLLKASAKPHNDERDYVYPDKLKREYIPQEVFDFFDKMHDTSISDDDLYSDKLDFKIGDCPGVIGYGGIHAAIPHYFFKEHDGRVIRNEDVSSYYPHLMTLFGYTSRNIPSAKVYEDVLEMRMKAKASGDKATANALKLVVNTSYGATLNPYNDLYDPLMGRSVCITGQLFLMELAQHCYKDIPGLVIVQLNTDGIMVECGKKDLPKLNEICAEWQSRTGFELEEDSVIQIAQKDVNNYVEVQGNGESKCKGGFLTRGISTKGAFNINNNYTIVAKAVKDYLLNDIPVEKTISECNDPLAFQQIAKAGSKYREAYHLVDGVKEPIQKVNRVYATADLRYGKLYKIKAITDAESKIEALPEHCIIDNEATININQIDKSWYIEVAKDKIKKFKGIKPPKKERKMAATKAEKTEKVEKTETVEKVEKAPDYKTMNVYQKLILARQMFLESDYKKSGKNMHLSFKYFELEDIVPNATKIFKELGLIGIDSFSNMAASMTIINADKPDEHIQFEAPFNQITPIISNQGKQATNEMQALGSSITYMRRYLYLMALDICEPDEINKNLRDDDDVDIPVPAPKKAPATPEQRKEVKKELTAVNDNASELQIKGLKNVLKELIAKDPSKKEIAEKIALQTKSFTEISKSDCEKLTNRISDMVLDEVGIEPVKDDKA